MIVPYRRCQVIEVHLAIVNAQDGQAVTGGFQDAISSAASFAQGFEKVFQAGQGIGQSVQFSGFGDPMPLDELHAGQLRQGIEIGRRLLDLQDAQGTRNLAEQMRHVRQLRPVPAGLDECHEALPGLGEIGQCLTHQGIQHLTRLGGWDRCALDIRRRLSIGRTAAESHDLVVKRRFHVQEGARDIEQVRLLDRTPSFDQRFQQALLFQHDTAGNGQIEHVQGVGNSGQGHHMTAERIDRGADIAHVQIECVLDPQ